MGACAEAERKGDAQIARESDVCGGNAVATETDAAGAPTRVVPLATDQKVIDQLSM